MKIIFINRCDQSCSKGCAGPDTECDQQFNCAKGCKLNYWGPTSVPCSDTCEEPASPEEKCSTTDGFCKFGCKPSSKTFGRNCSQACPEHCKDGKCSQITGECLYKCQKGYFGEYCNNLCSQNCPDNDCHPENGTCVAATCLVGQFAWYGPTCDLRCPVNCYNQICNRDSGDCLNGCAAGYSGQICNMTGKLPKCIYATHKMVVIPLTGRI